MTSLWPLGWLPGRGGSIASRPEALRLEVSIVGLGLQHCTGEVRGSSFEFETARVVLLIERRGLVPYALGFEIAVCDRGLQHRSGEALGTFQYRKD